MWRPAILISLWTLAIGLPGQAQSPPAVPPTIAGAPVITGAPDVLVLVYQRPGLGDQVDVTYAQTVPHAQAAQDLAALTKETGWVIKPNTIKDASAPVRSRFGPMTSVAFTAANVVQNDTHTLPVETFVRAFHGYKRLNLVFIVSTGFTFQGPRQYADNHWQFTLDQHGSAYTYQIAIRDPSFGSLSLTNQSPAAASGGRHPAPWLVFLGIIGASVGVGLIVFVLTKRLVPPDERVTIEEPIEETRDASEKSVEVANRG